MLYFSGWTRWDLLTRPVTADSLQLHLMAQQLNWLACQSVISWIDELYMYNKDGLTKVCHIMKEILDVVRIGNENKG